MFKKIVNTLIIIIAFGITPVFASSGWIVYRESDFKGKVIDAEIKEPIEGAVAVAIYHVRKYGIGAGIMSDSVAVDIREVLTNKN